MIEQDTACVADFHTLFVDGSLFELLAKDESLLWQAAIKAYMRYAAGKVVLIIYGARFAADFLRYVSSCSGPSSGSGFQSCDVLPYGGEVYRPPRDPTLQHSKSHSLKILPVLRHC